MALKEKEVPVGCVVVYKNEIIGRGHNETVATRNATRHAEFVAIDQILQKYDESIFTECELYVTVEPCTMCASALVLLKFKRVYCGCMNDKFGGCGSVYSLNTCFDHQYSCINGLYAQEAIELLQQFYSQENPLAPNPKKKRK